MLTTNVPTGQALAAVLDEAVEQVAGRGAGRAGHGDARHRRGSRHHRRPRRGRPPAIPSATAPRPPPGWPRRRWRDPGVTVVEGWSVSTMKVEKVVYAPGEAGR